MDDEWMERKWRQPEEDRRTLWRSDGLLNGGDIQQTVTKEPAET